MTDLTAIGHTAQTLHLRAVAAARNASQRSIFAKAAESVRCVVSGGNPCPARCPGVSKQRVAHTPFQVSKFGLSLALRNTGLRTLTSISSPQFCPRRKVGAELSDRPGLWTGRRHPAKTLVYGATVLGYCAWHQVSGKGETAHRLPQGQTSAINAELHRSPQASFVGDT